MSEIKLSPAQQRQMDRLAEHIDGVTQGDARYFECHPDRLHRVRGSHPAEIAQCEILSEALWAPPPGHSPYTVVRNVSHGARLRIFIFGPEDGGDVDEDMAGALFDTYAPPHIREIEAQMRKFAGTRE